MQGWRATLCGRPSRPPPGGLLDADRERLGAVLAPLGVNPEAIRAALG
jgi:hypothetical protein